MSIYADVPPPPNLTPHIDEADDQYVAGGSFGDVYKCWCDIDDSRKEVAVKAFRFKFTVDKDSGSDTYAKAIYRELGIWRGLDHPNVVPFLGVAYGFGMLGGLSLVSLWMPNDSLHRFLAKHDNDLGLGHQLQVLLDIANGLHYLHSLSLVHGDLNCHNVLLDADYTARLADFGFASIVGNVPEALNYLQTSTTRPGALRWSAPEQLDAGETFGRTPQSDIYSFGCISLQVLSGKQPWSEIREDAMVAFRLGRGHKPSRPAFRALDDLHWNFIQQCWSPIEKRPAMEVIVTTVQRFLGHHLQPRSLRDELMSRSRHVDPIMHPSSSPPIPAATRAPYFSDPGNLPPPGPSAQLPAPGPSSDGPRPFDTLPALKKEGDWSAIFNPKVKRVLDVGLLHTLRQDGFATCVQFSADGNLLAAGCDRTIRIYDVRTGEKTCVLVDKTPGKVVVYIRSVCFSFDGRYVATGAEDHKTRIWDLSKQRMLHVFDGHERDVYSVKFSQDGRLLISGSCDATVRIWDVVDGSSKLLVINDLDPQNTKEAAVASVAISPNGQLVAAACLDSVVRIWDISTGMLIERLRGHRDGICSVSFTPDGKALVSGSLDKTLKYWDVSGLVTGAKNAASKGKQKMEEASRCTMNFVGHTDFVTSAAVSHDGRWVVSGSKDRGVRFWDAHNATAHCMIRGHNSPVIAVDLSPTGNLLATASADMRARIWSYRTA